MVHYMVGDILGGHFQNGSLMANFRQSPYFKSTREKKGNENIDNLKSIKPFEEAEHGT